MSSILEVQNLHAAYCARSGDLYPALAGVSFSLGSGEILGVLGESGSGKSTLAAAVLKLLPPNGKIQSGKVLFEGKDLLQAAPLELRRIRGGRIGLIFQEPSSALHPTLRIGQQISDVISAHSSLDRRGLRDKVDQLLASIFPTGAERIARSYPHELSGGQRQRVLIAQAIACGPSLLIADEPTSSLDPTTQQEILALLRSLRERLNLSIILITHNPALLPSLADRVLVLYAGRVAELGSAAEVLSSSRHPYTEALFQCLPSVGDENQWLPKSGLHVIPGDPPDPSSQAPGCQFEPRCAERMEICRHNQPASFTVSRSHSVSCFKFAG
jgi:oligopeptide/dipeptide ABC transporter ATP-binding protein